MMIMAMVMMIMAMAMVMMILNDDDVIRIMIMTKHHSKYKLNISLLYSICIGYINLLVTR